MCSLYSTSVYLNSWYLLVQKQFRRKLEVDELKKEGKFIKSSTVCLRHVHRCRLPNCNLCDNYSQWLETLDKMYQNGAQLLSYIHSLYSLSSYILKSSYSFVSSFSSLNLIFSTSTDSISTSTTLGYMLIIWFGHLSRCAHITGSTFYTNV